MFEIALTVWSICELATACSLIARCIGRGAPSAYAVEIAANPAKANRALMDNVGTDFRGITCLQFRYRGSGKPEAFRPYKAAAHCRNSYERRCARRSRSRREPTTKRCTPYSSSRNFGGRPDYVGIAHPCEPAIIENQPFSMHAGRSPCVLFVQKLRMAIFTVMRPTGFVVRSNIRSSARHPRGQSSFRGPSRPSAFPNLTHVFHVRSPRREPHPILRHGR